MLTLAHHSIASVGGSTGKDFEAPGNEGANAEVIPAMRLSAEVFPTLGVQPLLGRGFEPEHVLGAVCI